MTLTSLDLAVVMAAASDSFDKYSCRNQQVCLLPPYSALAPGTLPGTMHECCMIRGIGLTHSQTVPLIMSQRTWQPSTLSMATVGTSPVHCTCGMRQQPFNITRAASAERSCTLFPPSTRGIDSVLPVSHHQTLQIPEMTGTGIVQQFKSRRSVQPQTLSLRTRSRTCTDVLLTTSQEATTLSNTRPVLAHWSSVIAFSLPFTCGARMRAVCHRCFTTGAVQQQLT